MSVRALSGAERPPALWPRQWLFAVLAVAAVAGLVALASLLFGAATAPMPRSPHPFALGTREGAASATGFAGWLLAWQSQFFTALRSALTELKNGGGGGPLLLAIGFAYGIFHAAGPGHGKAIVAAYIVSSEAAAARGLLVSALAALIQALVAIALVTAIFIAIGGTARTMSATTQVVEWAGFAIVALLGAALVWRKSAKLAAIATPGAALRAEADCACGPVDPAATGRGFGRMAAVALGAGIRPCAGAIVVLTLARSYGMYAIGVAATLAMALGTAVTTGALALLSVRAKALALRLASGRGRSALLAGAAAELVAAAFVLVIGLALLAGLWEAGGGS